jgi:hypothetical protein
VRARIAFGFENLDDVKLDLAHRDVNVHRVG